MSIDVDALRDRVRIERVTVSYNLTNGRKGGGEFVSLTVKAAEGDFTVDEAHLVHKFVSKECMEMAYMDALARGSMSKNQVARDLPKRKRNYDALIGGLERKMNKKLKAEAKSA
jgi:hypothetical protein